MNLFKIKYRWTHLLFLLLTLPGPVKASELKIFAYGEKPGLSAAVKVSDQSPLLLHMARNEFELITVQLSGENAKGLTSLKSYSIQFTDKKAPQIELKAYLVGSHSFPHSSFAKTPSGEVPDILIPNELSAQKGFKIPKENIPTHPTYLFEIYNQDQSPSGFFSGFIRFSDGKNDYKVPLKLVTYSTRLPSAFEMKTSFGYSPGTVIQTHYGKWANDLILNQKYFELASEHRIDLHKIYLKFPDPPTASQDYDPLVSLANPTQGFMGQWSELRDGKLGPHHFKWKTTDLPVPSNEKSNPTEQFWTLLNASVKKHNLTDSFVYYVDEPKTATFSTLAAQLKKIKKWAPDIQFLVTTHFNSALKDAFTIWCPNLIQWDVKGFPTPEFYQQIEKEKKEALWLYTGCNAHGCGGAEDIMNPDLVTDRPSAYQRALAWVALRYQAKGILYYNTIEAYGATPLSPWKDPFLFTGYGEGNLFYPCRPEVCGIAEQLPLPSMRLKIIRDGLEDAQILFMAEKAKAPVQQWLHTLIPNTRSFPTHTDEFEKVKIKALEALEKK